MYPHFPASQTEIADLFTVEQKKFFTSVTGREYEGGGKLPKVRKLDLDKPPDTKGDKDKKKNAPQRSWNHNHLQVTTGRWTPRCQSLKMQNHRNQRNSTLRSHNQHKGGSVSPRNNCHYLLIMPELIFYSLEVSTNSNVTPATQFTIRSKVHIVKFAQ